MVCQDIISNLMQRSEFTLSSQNMTVNNMQRNFM